VRNAVQILIGEKNMLFDDMFKNLGNNKELSDFIYELLMLGELKPFDLYDSVVFIGIQYGFFKRAEGNDKVLVSNRIFESWMLDYFVSKDMARPRFYVCK